MEKVFDFLEASGVDVLRITDSNADDMILDDDDADIDKLDEEEIELDKIDLSVPEGVSIEDPVRMYLKELVRFRFFQQKRKSNLQREWRMGMRLQETSGRSKPSSCCQHCKEICGTWNAFP